LLETVVVVVSEFMLSLPSDSYRIEQLVGSFANNGHPMSKFMWGKLYIKFSFTLSLEYSTIVDNTHPLSYFTWLASFRWGVCGDKILGCYFVRMSLPDIVSYITANSHISQDNSLRSDAELYSLVMFNSNNDTPVMILTVNNEY